MSDFFHKDNNPTTDCDLNSAIEKKEDSAYPGDLVCEGKSCLREYSPTTLETGVLLLVFAPSFIPESAGGVY
jgi:hypothetical protein